MINLIKSEIFISIFIASITVFFTNYFTYIFTLKKESRQLYSKYRIEILEKLYTPIYKILIRSVHPMDGYEGISGEQFVEIEKIIEDNYMLVDAKLDTLIWGLEEEAYVLGYSESHFYLDCEKELLKYVKTQYNKLRRLIGLPYEKDTWFKKIYRELRFLYRRVSRQISKLFHKKIKK